ncbi:hypothetical protein Zm00014a_027226 [Zea mays]|uniref:Uncharacterized protein n=1 Tax=Zea mays TaxID=4577 RepID=A0A3L6D657_MAIZE|nr:hypothetical protein Zm00014a_027226 [Zea mays]
MPLWEDQRKLRQHQRKLRDQEAKLRSLRKEFYLEHRFPLGAGEEDTRVHDQGVDNVNGTCNADGGRAHVYREYNSNGGRQGYPKRKVQRYVVKAKQPSSSGAPTDQVHHTPEDKVTSDSGSEAPVEIAQDETVTSTNADAAPASGIAGKKKNANGGNEVDKAKKQGSSETDLLKKADKEQLTAYPMEEEKKTLVEYERIHEDKKSSVEASRSAEVRKVSADEFEGLRMLERKKLDDDSGVMKAEKVQHKAKDQEEGGKDADDAKPKKVVIPMKDLSFQPPRRAFLLEDGTSNGGGLRLVAASMTAASSPAAATTAPTPGFVLAVVAPMAGRSRTRMTTATKVLRGAATTTTTTRAATTTAAATSGTQAMTTTGHGDVATPATAATLPLPPSPWSSTTWIFPPLPASAPPRAAAPATAPAPAPAQS